MGLSLLQRQLWLRESYHCWELPPWELPPILCHRILEQQRIIRNARLLLRWQLRGRRLRRSQHHRLER